LDLPVLFVDAEVMAMRERGLLATRAQSSIFFMLRRREAWQLSHGGPKIWIPAASGSVITTSVVRVPEHLGARLREAVLPAGDGDGRHYVYPVGDLHVTLANLDGYRDVPVEQIEEALTDCLSRVGPITLGLRGLAISRGTVFAPVYVSPVSTLFRLRAAIHRSLAPASRGILKSPVDVIGFCNALRFRHHDISVVSALVSHYRDIEFGRFLIEEVEIVRTDKILSAANTFVLAKCARRSP
jgi:2'-5' RNA ligase